MSDASTAAGFSADWLRLREPFDTAARALAARRLGLGRQLPRLPAAADGARRIVDLACGTGASLRALAPRLGGEQHWLVVDHDPALLAGWPAALADWAARAGHRVEARGEALTVIGRGFEARIERRCLDLARDLDTLPFDGAALVTGSALLDLVSASWLSRLVNTCAHARVAACFALSVDGRVEWSPPDVDDAWVEAHFRAHQGRDKGFGPALGPQAPDAAARAFRAAGHRVLRARSDWEIGPARDEAHHPPGDGGADALAMQRALIDGMAAAAIEQAPQYAARLRAWQARRQAIAPQAVLRIGHADLLALPLSG